MQTQSKTSFIVNLDRNEVLMERVFDAPRELVYKTYTDPKLVPQWWGPKYLTTIVEKMDVRPGGEWRFIQRDPDGSEYAFHGVYREVVPHERLVYTFVFEGDPANELTETVMFEAQEGRTKVTAVDTAVTVEGLKAMVDSGMEEGAIESFERFADLLKKVHKESR